MKKDSSLPQVLSDYPKEVILKDGSGVTLKPLKMGNEKALIRMLKTLSAEEQWFLNRDINDPKIIRNWIENANEMRCVYISAVLERRIIGFASIHFQLFGSQSHVGEITISIDPLYRRKRLGTWMLLDLVNLGMAIGLKILVMGIAQDRDAQVIDWIREIDFVEHAVLEDFVIDRDGHTHNLILMTKYIPMEWDNG